MAAEHICEVPEHKRLKDYTTRASGAMHLEHHVAITEVNLELACHLGWDTWKWDNSLTPLYYELPDQRRREPGRYLRPDATILTELDNGKSRTVYLEVDMGTERDQAIRAKVDAYKAALDLGWNYSENDRPAGVVPDHDIGIVFACTTEKERSQSAERPPPAPAREWAHMRFHSAPEEPAMRTPNQGLTER